jgi:hypothetical protein
MLSPPTSISLKKHNEPLAPNEECVVAPLDLKYDETSAVKPREVILSNLI